MENQPSGSGSYQIHGNVVEHVTCPRFHTVIVVQDGQRAGLRTIEWVDDRRSITPTHAQFLAATALLAWSLRQGPGPR